MQQSSSFRIDLDEVYRVSEAVQMVCERLREIVEANNPETEEGGPSQPDDKDAQLAQEGGCAFTLLDGRAHGLWAKNILIAAFNKEALQLFARLRRDPAQGGPVDWLVPRLLVEEYRKGLRIVSLGNEANPLIRQLWHSDSYVHRKRFWGWLNATLPRVRPGEWNSTLDTEAVRSLAQFLKGPSNASKDECFKHLRSTWPDMPKKAFVNRIWARGREAAGLPAKGSPGKKPGKRSAAAE
ncbi:hypothetical protein [Mesorhizobium marinum]|uniref:hypothetical protein n=1 Tax=Mesorhizobium marinum TaxID=3228790 RepID=UPI0034652C03